MARGHATAGRRAARACALEVGVFGAEPWTEEMRDRIEQQLGLKALNVYGLSEIVGPGVSCECLEAQTARTSRRTISWQRSSTPTPASRSRPAPEGELVLTTLTKEALPLVRYRTGDISSSNPEPCVCGRTTVRMARRARPPRRHAHHPRRQPLSAPRSSASC